MEILRQRLIQLLEIFESNNVLKGVDKESLLKMSALEVATYMQKLFKENYPHLNIKRLMQTVHYANSYEDKDLQQIAFIVDEISEYLYAEELANRDYVVGYFNTFIIGTTFDPTELNFVIVEVESLIENYNVK